ncbi:hypothetical protein ABTK11_22850, partial [Acinetobacter baumannii]
VNTLTPPELLRYYLDDSAARVAIVEPEFAGLMTALANAGSGLDRIVVVGDQAASGPVETTRVTMASGWLAGFDDTL